MGLVYVSGESSKLVSALKSNISSSKSTTAQLTSGSQIVVEAVDGKTLSGSAYMAAKGLFSEVIIPTIMKATSAIDKLESELQTYISADGIVSGEGKLDEDKLNQQITTKKAMKASVEKSLSFSRSVLRTTTSPDITGSLKAAQSSLTQMSAEYSENIRELEEKLEKLHEFASTTSSLFSNSLNDLKIAMQGVSYINKAIISANGSYVLPKTVTNEWLDELYTEGGKSSPYDDMKALNKFYKEWIKTSASNFTSIWYGARIDRLSDGTLIVKTATGISKKIDELTGFITYVNQNRDFTRIGSKFGELTPDGLKILKKTKMSDFDMLTKGSTGRLKETIKSTGNTIKSGVKSGATKNFTFSMSTVMSETYNLKSAKGIGKAVPILNIVSGVIDVGTGLKDSAEFAKQDGLKGGEVLASQLGGALIDTGKAVATTVVSSVAASVASSVTVSVLGALGVATAPVAITVGAGLAAAWVVSRLINKKDKEYKGTESIKKGINGLIKGVGGWFK